MLLLKKIKLRFKFNSLKPTAKTKAELKHQIISVKGQKDMKAYEYLEYLATKLPKMYKGIELINNLERLKHYYYTYDMKGVECYIALCEYAQERDIKRLQKFKRQKP